MNVRSIEALSPTERRAIFERDAGISDIESDVATIVERVREEGDVALRKFSREFDDVEVGNLDITDEAERALDGLDDELLDAIEAAAANITDFHEAQLPEDWMEPFGPGRELGRRFRAIERVGSYVPGGSAPYPSSALMTILPAKVAGVEHVAVATPPGSPINPITLAAIHIAGGDAVYQVGGAQAIAALAYGTETVDRVQKIVGPGNRWVTAAKSLVRGEVEIDFLAGPSEILILADETAEPLFVAADILAQAEHDPNAVVACASTDIDIANEIAKKVTELAADCKRSEIILAALENEASGIFVGRSESELILFAEEFAPEHLSVQMTDEESILNRVDSAGSVFLGPHTPVAAGDYASGTNHVLPTNGLAKVTGGLSVDTFLRSSTIQRLSQEGLDDVADIVSTLAEAEGLDAHARSVEYRLK